MRWNNSPKGESNCRKKGCKYYDPEPRELERGLYSIREKGRVFYCRFKNANLFDCPNWECEHLEVE